MDPYPQTVAEPARGGVSRQVFVLGLVVLALVAGAVIGWQAVRISTPSEQALAMQEQVAAVQRDVSTSNGRVEDLEGTVSDVRKQVAGWVSGRMRLTPRHWT